MLFLRWENRCPDEWGAPASGQWSAWTTKVHLLHDLARRGVPRGGEGVELVVAALERPYRCKDWMFARVARRVDGPELPASRGAWARWRAPDPRGDLHDHPRGISWNHESR
ncbi:hypothetical protein KCV87_03105 [Actinosynnema pretiosum subsp. pretiosum]|uniref:Uncharacterized protein n=1 Tax=Actinosynnema pretiosum subsp. pretiosum TaxID=103721 RepID=A0AA45L8I0_9PSEU|nr:hypothetical protein APASM_3399 [Actinosynnema pretiosum subsp. pretiosum]QUF05120.1 hypothetical protein KCV87_03105 [Actinosynnema pretiosum subsp. pretiosum]